MRSCGLHALFLLLLACNTSVSTFSFQDISGREMRQYNDVDDESFIGLMGKRTSGLTAELPLKRDAADVFVGLFGHRNTDTGLAPWRRERRGESSLRTEGSGFDVPFEALSPYRERRRGTQKRRF